AFDGDTGGAPKGHHMSAEAIGRQQALFHIDMFVTILEDRDGDATCLVGDPVPFNDENGKEVVLLDTDGFELVADQLCELGYRVVRNPITTRPFDKRSFTVAGLQNQAFSDLKAIGNEAAALGSAGGAKVDVYEHYVQSWNNVLIETEVGRRQVIMPTYGSEFDAANAEIYRDLGYDVRCLPDCTEFAYLQGAAHCLLRDIGRTGSVGPVTT
ncbi:hypothetical protein OAH97_01110, partial [Octadecabacter sp.]|nr:hypothetical protein [Octadecabacter sp.]